MIDLRSDTVTVPSVEMRDYMMNAKVGDDVYGEDPTVNVLQEKVAELFDKEAALFVPSGTMGNQISLKINTNPGEEVITEENAHIFYYETAAPAMISQIQIRTISSDQGMMDLDKIENAIRPDIYYFPKTSLICLENTHNRHGGTIIDIEYIKDVRELANNYNLKMHLDGARLWNAHAASGVELKEYAKYFDTINVCLSKGLGAPVGSLIISNKSNIEKALKVRKILGGGMRQAGILAAAGIYAIDKNLPKLELDHNNALTFAEAITKNDNIHCNLSKVETNIVVFDLGKNLDSDKFVKHCLYEGLVLSSIGNNQIRVVFHLDISNEDTLESIKIIEHILNNNESLLK